LLAESAHRQVRRAKPAQTVERLAAGSAQGDGVLGRRTFLAGFGAVTVALIGKPSAAAGMPFAWPSGKRAAVSLTYDDGLDSQLANAAPQLDEFGLKATFFLTRENMEARVDDWIALAKRGHEIADHTNTHPCGLRGYSSVRFDREQIAPTEQFLDDHFPGPHPRTYAFPCGFTGLGSGDREQRWTRYRDVLKAHFLAARTVDGGPNDPREVAANRFQLNGFEPTYDRDTPYLAYRYVDKAIRHVHWAILIFHEVLDQRAGPGDTSKAVHRQILQRLVDAPVWCAPMREVFTAITRPDPAAFPPQSARSAKPNRSDFKG
jgi:peptidoglycan/xylan/chitin deacetylase (PgdA/CDA1 family)